MRHEVLKVFWIAITSGSCKFVLVLMLLSGELFCIIWTSEVDCELFKMYMTVIYYSYLIIWIGTDSAEDYNWSISRGQEGELQQCIKACSSNSSVFSYAIWVIDQAFDNHSLSSAFSCSCCSCKSHRYCYFCITVYFWDNWY